MNDNLNMKEKYVDFLMNKLEGNDKRFEELLQDERVKEILSIIKENQTLKLLLRYEMENCSHLFVQTSEVRDEEYPDGIKIYHCLKCGLTNEYGVKRSSTCLLDEFQSEVDDLYYKTATNGVLIMDEMCSLEVAKNLYKLIITGNPYVSISEIIEIFSELYPKSDKRKSAAELWYEMEDRSDEIAIATLTRLVENKEGKNK